MIRYAEFAVEVAGRRYTGTWHMEDQDVVVSSAWGSDRAPLKRSTPVKVAERLLTAIAKARTAPKA